MSKLTVYRYDECDYSPVQPITSTYDHYSSLNECEKESEDLLRASSAERNTVRTDSVYTWEDEGAARRTFEIKKRSRPN